MLVLVGWSFVGSFCAVADVSTLASFEVFVRIVFNTQTDACAVTHLLKLRETHLRATPRTLVVGRHTLMLAQLTVEPSRLRLCGLEIWRSVHYSVTYSTHLPLSASTAMNCPASSAGAPLAASGGDGFAAW